MAIGQDKLQSTPLQMAMVAAAVANGGALMRPYLGDPRRRPRRAAPTMQNDARGVSPASCRPPRRAKITAMMTQRRPGGNRHGRRAAGHRRRRQDRHRRARRRASDINHAVVHRLRARASDPQVAVAVTIERSVGGFGGTVAAPIAKAVMESLLR